MTDEGQGSSVALPPFIAKTYEMVDDVSTDPIVSWSQSNKSFIVWNPPEFSRILLPRFFKHSNFSSFIRQLNTYGFRKIDPEKWEFANDDFIRGQPRLLKNIHRRKAVHSHSIPNPNLQGASSSSLSDSERQAYKEDIERLRYEKDSLDVEVQKHNQEKQQFELQMQVLSARLQQVEQRQKDILSSLALTFHKPEIASGLMPPLEERNHRKRRLPRKSPFQDDGSSDDDQTSSSLGFSGENLNSSSPSGFNKELLEQLESSLSFWETLVLDVAIVNIPEISPLDIDVPTNVADSPAASYPQVNVADSPAASYPQVNVDLGYKTSEIDMNSEPATAAVPEIEVSKEKVAGSEANVSGSVNDVFWEQFFTEDPGSNNAPEVRSERKDPENRKTESRPNEHGKFWWNMRNVNNLTDQLGQLAPTERT